MFYPIFHQITASPTSMLKITGVDFFTINLVSINKKNIVNETSFSKIVKAKFDAKTAKF